jgi:ribosomal-protein-alanine N-acetyltransferase
MEKRVIFTETERLILRNMDPSDYKDLCKILQDNEVMYAYEGAFDDQEVQNWLDRQMARYREDGFGLCAVIKKDDGKMIGQCGLTMQEIPGKRVIEVGYLFCKEYWHQGYAIEAARACKKYAFEVLKAKEVFSIIRDNNIPSQNVAKRNGMRPVDLFVKHYRGVEMPHIVFSVRRAEAE